MKQSNGSQEIEEHIKKVTTQKNGQKIPQNSLPGECDSWKQFYAFAPPE